MLAAGSIVEFLMGWGLSDGLARLMAAGVHAGLIIAFFGVAPVVYIWLERKVAGRLQDRLGPTRVGGRFGWLQSVADGIKLVQKEDLCPQEADPWLFRLSPFVVFAGSYAAFIALPWSDGWVGLDLDSGLFFMLAVMSIEVLGIILAGYGSGSKWSLFGGMREAAQVVSYEIPMALSALVPVIVAGSFNLLEVGRLQAGWFFNWLVFHDPVCALAALVYFVVATASVKRAPFDLAEAESELVAGFHTEYSGIRWSFFFMAEYASMFAVSGIAVTLFFGGWNLGIPLLEWLGLTSGSVVGLLVGGLVGLLVFVVKSSLLVFVQMWVRWTLPRLRVDQVMTTCLKYLLPISCAMLVGICVWPLLIYQVTKSIHGSGRTVLFGPALGDRRVASWPAARKDAVQIVQIEAAPDRTAPVTVAPAAESTSGANR